MGKPSRDKGKRGEREVVQLFKQHGFVAHRTAQVDGTLSSDVRIKGLPLHVEVKRYAKIGAFRFWAQAVSDSEGQEPALFMREDGGEWLVCVRPSYLLPLLSPPS